MSAQRGLGKGLGALIAMFDEEIETTKKERTQDLTVKESKKEVEKVVKEVEKPSVIVPRGTIEVQDGVQEVDVNLIDKNVNQPRKIFDPVQLQELADSISANGVFQPIIVKKIGARYMIVAGERRWRASKLAGLAKIPAIVRDYSERQIAEIAIVENLQRENLNEIELANGIKRLMDEFFLTQEKVAVVLGKSRSSIANTLRLLNLPREVQSMIESEQLSAGHAKCLVAVSNSEQCIGLAKKCVVGRLSVRELEDLLKDMHEVKRGTSAAPKKQSVELKNLVLELTQIFGTKVMVQGNENRGKIVIEYYNQADLERIRKKLV
ncbi:MAG: ParB/RepB/Spo0J family partition protein [Firmicutes bacterium]|nr:ParB/RepB/Spo0J family partition protein [Bacillota bacterium]